MAGKYRTWNPSLVPGLSCFYALRFVLTIIHGSGRAAKNGEGLGAFITWVTSGCCKVDMGGGLSILLVLDQFVVQLARFERFTTSGDWRPCRQFHSTVCKLTYSGASPSLHPLDVMNVLRSSTALLLLCVIININWREKKWGRPGNEANETPSCIGGETTCAW